MRSGLVFLLLGTVTALPADEGGRVEFFEKKIRPVLAQECFACHSAQAPVAQGGLRLDSAAGLRAGGNRGQAIVPGDPEQSLLVRALRHQDKQLQMPPGKKLDAERIADFERWIREGAVFPEAAAGAASGMPALWSLQPLRKPRPGESIDTFIQARLREKGLSMSPPADRRTLLRRAYYDVTGLPPAFEEIEAFLKDQAPDAWERVVDRLLSSPHYGERWGRHWLDVARYSDQRDLARRFPYSYTYRDWVIRALNEDMPYDRFVRLQIAADLALDEARPSDLAALGFLTLGRDPVGNLQEMIDDRIDVVTRGLMGFTVSCARCHDHKYDPIPARNYYSLYSIFLNSVEPEEPPPLDPNATASPREAGFRKALARRLEDIEAYKRTRFQVLIEQLRSPDEIARYIEAVPGALKIPAGELDEYARNKDLNLYLLRRWMFWMPGRNLPPDRDEAARFVLADPDNPMNVPFSDMKLIQTEGDNNNLRDLGLRVWRLWVEHGYRGSEPRAMALYDAPSIEPAHVLIRGNPNNKGAPVAPQFLDSLCKGGCTPFREGSGRLELAREITSPENALTARVFVNRVWQHYFGAGLVDTPSDFGTRAEPPSHPELLDYLAARLIENGWSIKSLHREILLSQVYRQSSADNPRARTIDPGNKLLWRMNRKRLDFEALRDSILAVSGQLDRTMYGLPFSLTAQPSVPRRTVYGFIDRTQMPAVLQAFDFPSPDQHSPQRFTTTVPQQALFLMNSPFVAEQVRHLASRATTIEALYRAVFGRPPEPREVDAGRAFLATQKEIASEQRRDDWSYGLLREGRFEAFRYFVDDTWQPVSLLPDVDAGYAALNNEGGSVGDIAVVRRWTAPEAGRASIAGTLRHRTTKFRHGDGVRGRIVSSREGEIASWVVFGREVETKISGVDVEAGDTIDFIVDGRDDREGDSFSWAPVITLGDKKWDAKADFRGPHPRPLTLLERYAQVLLQSNEFAFVD
jgi:hypothetical protein